ncbi:hypothetical protein [Streptomyces caeruleatus]|uniref:Uncharacterized protein n=1 Tax=Streptomyces caeruleatus TaxID=661399 RepID=A0A117RR09_9ACTN|nr:hypothetical protein [Streptomyces caeruleatus]KUO04520.1 hypothetical protein AQJ67_12370 [Streptomyces caeruleatus]
MAIAAGASAVALAASPASAATITINVGSQAIPSGAGCVILTDTSTGDISDFITFTPGSTATISGYNVDAGDYVHFDWRPSDCTNTIRDDQHQAPSPLPSVWNVN